MIRLRICAWVIRKFKPTMSGSSSRCLLIWQYLSKLLRNRADGQPKFDHICCPLPRFGVHVMGDFNVELLRGCDKSYQQRNDFIFKKSTLKNRFAPVIYIRPNCKPSCIENILTNDTDRSVHSGCISYKIGHHAPIFDYRNIRINTKKENDKHAVLSFYF